MGHPAPRSQLALDTNVLVALGKGENFALELLEVATERNCSLLLPPIALLEIGYSARRPGPLQAAALSSLRQLKPTGVIDLFNLDSTEQAIAEALATNLLSKDLLPVQERNDALMIAQVAVKNIPFLVTSDSHFLEISHEQASAVFLEHHLSPVSVISPKVLLRALSPGSKRPGKY